MSVKVENALHATREYLLKQPLITALVGEKIYVHAMPPSSTKQTFPLLVLQTAPASGIEDNHSVRNGAFLARCYGTTLDNASDLADTLLEVLNDLVYRQFMATTHMLTWSNTGDVMVTAEPDTRFCVALVQFSCVSAVRAYQ